MTARCDRCGRFTDATAVVINRHMTGDGLEVNDYEVCRRCWPEIERAES